MAGSLLPLAWLGLPRLGATSPIPPGLSLLSWLGLPALGSHAVPVPPESPCPRRPPHGGLHPALQALLTETVTHAVYLGQDAYGKPTYGPVHSHLARLEFRIRKVVDATGQERISRARLFFNSDAVLDLRDTIVLTDGTAPPILSCYSPRDETGAIDHWEISM